MTTPVRHLVETASTNIDARTAFETEDVTVPIWFTAARQTAGVGRRNRRWHHHAGNFAGTLLWPVSAEQIPTAPLYAFVAALAVAEAVDETGVSADRTRVKWPNDVLVDGLKLAGILCELIKSQGRHAVLIGIGANLLAAPPEEKAIALSKLLDKSSPIPSSFRELLDARIHAWMKIHEEAGFLPIRSAWLARAAGLGGPITVRQHDGVREGRFVGIDEDGTLLLGTGNGTERVMAAEIFLGHQGG